MRIRSARTLVFSREGRQLVGFNFLTRSSFACSADLLSFLDFLADWTGLEELAGLMPAMSCEGLRSAVQGLLEFNALTQQGSALAESEDEFQASWKWGIPAALFHFSLRDRKCLSLEQTEVLQLAKLAECEQPPLYQTNDWAGAEAIQLPPALEQNELLRLMARRRTIRSAAASPVTLAQLSDCLFAGLAITGETQNCAGSLPLSMTPSGGARNPYEAYVYVRAVEGLKAGFYHYAAFDHTLARLDTNDLPAPSELLGGQDWADEMPCVVILCALLERTMWKYDDANAYRVVLIEAGHIGQNILLAATRHGLSACPTAALNHSRINNCIGADNCFTHAPIYALTLAKPAQPV